MFGRKKRERELEESRQEALEAKRQAERELREVKARWPEVRREGAWHRLRRDQNHFARDLELLMRGSQ
jgi:hypothetical protein